MKIQIAFCCKNGTFRDPTKFEDKAIEHFIKCNCLDYKYWPTSVAFCELIETEKTKKGWKTALLQIADNLFKDRFGNQPFRIVSPDA